MEFINTLSILLLLVAVAITVMACVVIFNRRRQAQSTADRARRKAAEEERNAVWRTEEEERQRVEAERRWLEEELRRAKEERHKPEEESTRPIEEARREIQEAQRKEAQRLTEELRKAEEEQRRRETDEARRKAEDLRVAEEEDRRSEEESKRLEEETRRNEEEECKRLEEEERRKAGEVQREVDKERKRLEPGNRGGRPRAPTRNREKQPLQEGKPRCPKPEIVCWKKERQWIPAVEVPEELLENSALAVLQDGSRLPQDESREACWRVGRALGEVVVWWNEDEVPRETRIPLGKENYLLFKLSGQNQNQGRHVKSPSSGSYLLMVPDDWERDDTLSGSPPAAPEPVSLAGYKAHFFELEKDGDGKIAFRAPMGKSFVIESQALQFELVGSRLNEASGDKGPLFGERPPQIRAPDNQGWKDVETIVVGEEGSGKGRWRKPFSPIPGGTQQDLPSEVAARKGGWYFLRFYDTNDDLIESLDFRFICALKEIGILQPSPLPPEDGHGLVCVMFLHEPGCAVQPADGLTNIQIERQDDKTILTIPPDPTYDETRWLVGHEGGSQVEVTILVERLWWGIGEERNAPSEWEDQPFTLSRDDFAATSKRALWLRLPRRRWVDKVLVGFEQPKARPYDVKVTEKTIAVPFREFGDSKEVGDRTQEHSLKVWIKRENGHDEGVVEGVVAIIPKVGKEKRLLLNLDRISAPRLATVLTCLRKKTVGPLRVLVKEVRKKYSRERTARKAESVEFKRYALCMIALTLELTPQIPGFNNRYAVRAQLSRDEFPEIMNRLRNRYKEISTSRAYRAGIEGKHNESN